MLSLRTGAHPCCYPGSVKYNIPPCENIVAMNKIFCKSCFQLVTPAARVAWRSAFPYDVPYELATKPSHEDQRIAVLTFVQHVTFAKRQLSLFGKKGD